MLCVLTPTGGRPEALAMLASHLAAQTYPGPVRWVIVDDVNPASPVPAMPDRFTVDLVRPRWRWRPGDNTQCRSMLAALDRVPDGAVVVVAEDDDAMLPGHIDSVVRALLMAELVGERTARYYNISTRKYRAIRGSYHSSLAATALRGSAIAKLREVCERGSARIDMALWREFTGPQILLDTAHVIGMKGLRGRAGIGAGHRSWFGEVDADGSVLVQWLGADLAARYRAMGGRNGR